MVSWWNLFNLHWKEVLKEYSVATVDLMKSAQINFGLHDIKDRVFKKDLLDWFHRMDLKGVPGVFSLQSKKISQRKSGRRRWIHLRPSPRDRT